MPTVTINLKRTGGGWSVGVHTEDRHGRRWQSAGLYPQPPIVTNGDQATTEAACVAAVRWAEKWLALTEEKESGSPT